MPLFAKRKYSQGIKAFIIRLLVVVVLCVMQSFLWSFVKARAIDLQDKRSQTQQIIELNKRDQDISKNINTQKELLSQVDVEVPPYSSLTAIIEMLEKLGDQGHVTATIDAINNDAAKNDQTVGDIVSAVISLKVTGTLNQVFNYMETVEHLQELSRVTNWSLQRGTQNGAVAISGGQTAVSTTPPPVVYDMSLDILFYFKQDNANGTNR
jgi:gamma-glutamylcysteine synthetase